MTVYQRLSLHVSPVVESFGVDFNVSQPEIFRPTPDFRCKRFSRFTAVWRGHRGEEAWKLVAQK
jgi:hypothetical protein